MLKAFSAAKELPIPEVERPNVPPLTPQGRRKDFCPKASRRCW